MFDFSALGDFDFSKIFGGGSYSFQNEAERFAAMAQTHSALLSGALSRSNALRQMDSIRAAAIAS